MKWKYDKATLRIIWGVEGSTFQRRMKEIEIDSAFKMKFPRYKRNQRLLSSKLFFWLSDEFAERNQALDQIIENYGITNVDEIEKIKGFLGIKRRIDIKEVQGSYGLNKKTYY